MSRTRFLLFGLAFCFFTNQSCSVQSLFLDLIERSTCKYDCNGKLTQKPDYTAYGNGCGTANMHMDFNNTEFREFESCCNDHDLCYAKCGQLKNNCDDYFGTCLRGSCEALTYNQTLYTSCISQSDLMVTLVSNFGCNAFLNAQKEACDCLSD